MFRCGLVLADRRYPDQINEADLFSRLLIGLARTGLAPPSFYATEARGHIDGLPVDFIARGIVALALRGGGGHEIYHLVDDRRDQDVSFDRLIDWIVSAGVPMERCASHAEWFARFEAALLALDPVERKRSPFAVLRRWSQPIANADSLHFDTSRFLSAMSHEAFPRVTEAFVHQCLRALGLLR